MALRGHVLPVGPVVPVTLRNFHDWQQTLIEEEKRGGLAAPMPVSGYALVDTGAAVSLIRPDVADSLRACPAPTMKIKGLHPSQPWATVPEATVTTCYIGVVFPQIRYSTHITACKLPFAERDLILLLGRDILSGLRMSWDGPAGVFTIDSP